MQNGVHSVQPQNLHYLAFRLNTLALITFTTITTITNVLALLYRVVQLSRQVMNLWHLRPHQVLRRRRTAGNGVHSLNRRPRL